MPAGKKSYLSHHGNISLSLKKPRTLFLLAFSSFSPGDNFKEPLAENLSQVPPRHPGLPSSPAPPLRAGASLPHRLSPNQLGPTFPPRLRRGRPPGNRRRRGRRGPESPELCAGRRGSGLAGKTPAASGVRLGVLRSRTPRSQLPPSPPLGQLSKAPSPPLHAPPTTLPNAQKHPRGKAQLGTPR